MCASQDLRSLCKEGGEVSAKGMLLPIVLATVVILAGGAIPSSAARVSSGSLGPSLATAAAPVGPEFQISTPL